VTRTQSGQTLIMFALAMTFVFMGLIALVGDADTLMVRYNEVNSAALRGAQAGASDVDLAAFYKGVHQLDAGTVQSVCQTAAEQGNPQLRATCPLPTAAAPDTVTATVTEQVSLPIPLFATQVQVKATRQGRAVFGGAAPLP
jgi:hypothetical protein